LIKSSFVIPIPLSRIERIFFSLSNFICIISFHMFQTYKKGVPIQQYMYPLSSNYLEFFFSL
jgi:hypothetical protein